MILNWVDSNTHVTQINKCKQVIILLDEIHQAFVHIYGHLWNPICIYKSNSLLTFFLGNDEKNLKIFICIHEIHITCTSAIYIKMHKNQKVKVRDIFPLFPYMNGP